MNLLLGLVPWWGRILAVVAVLLAAAAFGAAKMHEHDQARYDALEAKFEAFKDQTAALGREAIAATKAKDAADKSRKEVADAENSAALATLAGNIAKLRARPGGRLVPSAAAAAGGPDVACFDRPLVERAYGALLVELRGLSDEGSKAVVDLNTAKRWAKAAPP